MDNGLILVEPMSIHNWEFGCSLATRAPGTAWSAMLRARYAGAPLASQQAVCSAVPGRLGERGAQAVVLSNYPLARLGCL
jgi:hypothetical protein